MDDRGAGLLELHNSPNGHPGSSKLGKHGDPRHCPFRVGLGARADAGTFTLLLPSPIGKQQLTRKRTHWFAAGPSTYSSHMRRLGASSCEGDDEHGPPVRLQTCPSHAYLDSRIPDAPIPSPRIRPLCQLLAHDRMRPANWASTCVPSANAA